jgi:hypothetical protein
VRWLGWDVAFHGKFRFQGCRLATVASKFQSLGSHPNPA